MVDNSSTSGDSSRTIDQHLEDISSPGTRRMLRRVCRANTRSANPASAETLWANANADITSRHQQPQQQQQTQEQRKSAAEQEQVLVAASLRRSAAAKSNNHSAFGINADNDSNGIDDVDIDDVNNVTDPRNRSLIDSLAMETVINDDAAIMNTVDENNNGTFNCDIIDYRFRWRIRRMQDHYITTPLSSPPSYCYGLRIGSSKPSPAQ